MPPLTSSSELPPITGNDLFERLRPHARWNLDAESLLREAVSRGEGALTSAGALRVMTGEYHGRSPKDKYTVRRSPSEAYLDWGSPFNHAVDPAVGEALAHRFARHAEGLPALYGLQAYVGRGAHRLPIALITERAWHCLMGRHMFLPATPQEAATHVPEFTLLYTPSYPVDPERDGVRSEVAILCDLERALGVIGGTEYGGEQKKFFFYLMNYRLPLRGAFPMHCSANVGPARDVSLIFGLSGTGKTTLSADPDRELLGDDEHGWDEDGVFNFEGGCYAKLIRLSREREPLIWDAVNRPGSIMENVTLTGGAEPDFAAGGIENTRGVYPLSAIPNVDPDGRAGHPNTVVFLTFDASGTLPPLAVLNETQALYWFLAGYTAKVAGTERGLGARPEPTFSACFGAPFLPLAPARYVELLGEYLRRHRPLVVLMNTGSLGGPLGAGGARPPIEVSRGLLRAAQSGVLRNAPVRQHPEYGFCIPETCPGVASELLDPRRAWTLAPAEYERSVRELVAAFHKQVNEVYAGRISAEILAAGPRLG